MLPGKGYLITQSKETEEYRGVVDYDYQVNIKEIYGQTCSYVHLEPHMK
jgi:hypothetical protein